MSGEVGRIQGGLSRARLAVVARLRLVSAGGLEGYDWRFVCWFRFRVMVLGGFELCPGCSAVGFRFVGVVYAALVLLALRALPCVVLRCLSFVLCVPVGMR